MEIVVKASRWGLNRLRSLAGEIRARSGGLEIKPAALPSIVKGSPLDSSAAVSSILDSIYRFSPSDRTIELAREKFPNQMRSLIDEADNFVERKFSILGVDIDYSDGIRWHYDPTNDHEFPRNVYFSKIRHSNPCGGYDIKYPWELSRLQHFPKLALAYRLTGEIQYRTALIEQAGDWFHNNPTAFGPNWACTMDVAIRAANLAFAFAILNDNHLESDFSNMLVTRLIEHGRFIATNLEWSDTLTSNHYLSNIAGLAVLASHLSGTVTDADVWLDFCRKELVNEQDKQIYPDGWDFEASTAYHRLVLELFLYSAIFMDRVGYKFDDDFYLRLGGMTKFMRDVSLPNGDFPLIGDNDSGLFLSLGTNHLNNVHYLLSLASSFLDNSYTTVPDPELLWFLGPLGLETFNNQPVHPIDEISNLSEFPEGGLFFLRSDDKKDLVTFRLGQVGQNGQGGHAHNDQLSITVWFDSRPVIIDPGSAVYTSDPVRRNHYRSTRSHATIALDNHEQNNFLPGELFKLPQTQKTEFLDILKDDNSCTISGATLGYGQFGPTDVRIQRAVTLDESKRRVEIRDEVVLNNSAKTLSPEWIFPLGGGITVASESTGYLKLVDSDENPVADILFLPGWKIQIIDTVYSPAYGVEKPNKTLVFTPPDGTVRGEFIIRAAMSDGKSD